MRKILPFPGAENLLPHESSAIPLSAIELGKTLYMQVRPRVPTAWAALDGVLEILTNQADRLPSPLPPVDRVLLIQLWRDEGWEHEWITEALARDLAPGELERLERLRALREQYETAQMVVGLCEARLHPKAPAPHRHGFSCSETCQMVMEPEYTPSAQDHQNWKNAHAACRELRDDIDQLADDLRRRAAEAEGTPYWKQRVDALYERIYDEYRGHGVVYDLLCRRLAEVATKIEMGLEGGVQQESAEFVRLRELHNSYINQIQKHTESTKTEAVTKEVQDACRRLLQIVEDRVAPGQPQLWLKVVQDVQKRLAVSEEEAS